jgi:hypothetical protein
MRLKGLFYFCNRIVAIGRTDGSELFQHHRQATFLP